MKPPNLLTINVTVVFMARYVMILRGATSLRDRVGIKKPTQKNPPKKNKKTHLKKPTKNGVFGFLGVFYISNFL